jgi:hypothetical protein
MSRATRSMDLSDCPVTSRTVPTVGLTARTPARHCGGLGALKERIPDLRMFPSPSCARNETATRTGLRSHRGKSGYRVLAPPLSFNVAVPADEVVRSTAGPGCPVHPATGSCDGPRPWHGPVGSAGRAFADRL